MNNQADIETIRLPGQVAAALRKFLSECRTGNVTLNIKDGRILGAHINEFISIKPAATINGDQHVELDRARNRSCPSAE